MLFGGQFDLYSIKTLPANADAQTNLHGACARAHPATKKSLWTPLKMSVCWMSEGCSRCANLARVESTLCLISTTLQTVDVNYSLRIQLTTCMASIFQQLHARFGQMKGEETLGVS